MILGPIGLLLVTLVPYIFLSCFLAILAY